MELRRCRGCGADLSRGSTSCPLCGAVAAREQPRPVSRGEVEAYQLRVQQLKETLDRLRRDSEAV